MTLLFNLHSQKNIRKILRSQEIIAEKALWNCIRRKQLGFRFRRQFGIGKYVVDFYCPELRLIIEVDGATHCTGAEIRKDIEREKFLSSLGLMIKRYRNVDIKENLDNVVFDIYNYCIHLKGRPLPNPPLRKGRE